MTCKYVRFVQETNKFILIDNIYLGAGILPGCLKVLYRTLFQKIKGHHSRGFKNL